MVHSSISNIRRAHFVIGRKHFQLVTICYRFITLRFPDSLVNKKEWDFYPSFPVRISDSKMLYTYAVLCENSPVRTSNTFP